MSGQAQQRHSSDEGRNRAVPAPFALPVRMPAIHQHRDEECGVRQRAKKTDIQIRKSGLAFEHSRQPEKETVKREVIQKADGGEQQNCRGSEGLPDGHSLDAGGPLLLQFIFYPLTLIGSEPFGLTGQVRQIKKRYDAEQNSRQPFQNK